VVGATPVPLNVTEVLPNLKTGAVNALNAPALAAEQLQWSPELDNVVDDPTGCAIGALVFSSKRVSDLPGDLRTILTDTGSLASNALGRKVKEEDAAAYGRMLEKMNKVTLSDTEKAAWASKFAETRKRLQGTFDAALVKKIEGFAGL
jgi:TRAP-type C4-dicarboxylate transport system substrate-binding protein